MSQGEKAEGRREKWEGSVFVPVAAWELILVCRLKGGAGREGLLSKRKVMHPRHHVRVGGGSHIDLQHRVTEGPELDSLELPALWSLVGRGVILARNVQAQTEA